MDLTIAEMRAKLEELDDEIRLIELLNLYSFQYKSIYPEFAKELSDRALLLARRQGYRRGEALALANKGIEAVEISHYKESLEQLEEAERILKSLPPAERGGLNRVLNSLGCLYIEQAYYIEGANYLREALNLSEEENDSIFMGKVYVNMAYMNERQSDYEQALDYSLKADKLLENSSDYYSLVINLLNMAEFYQKLGLNREALKPLERAAKTLEKRGLNRLKGGVMYCFGITYLNMENYEMAESYFRQGLEDESSKQIPFYKVDNLNGYGKLCRAGGELERAIGYWKEALDLALENGISVHLPELNRELTEAYEELGDYERAYHYLKEYSALKAQEFSLEMKSSIKNVEAESLRRTNERIQVISSIGRKINTSLQMENLLDNIYSSVNSLMDATIFGLASYDSEQGRICYDKFIDDGVHSESFYCDVEDKGSLAAYAIRERSDIFINDASVEMESYVDINRPLIFKVNKENLERAPQSLMVVPLLIEDEVTGIVTVQSYEKGAYSHLDLDSLKILAAYIAIALKNARQSELIKSKNRELKRLSVTDYLTGVYNRREFERQLNRTWEMGKTRSLNVSILLLDADHFKSINDNFGHPAGDECLKKMAALIRANIREDFDCLARYGGEEFIILLNSPKDEAYRIGERIRAQIEEFSLESGGEQISLTVSVGISSVELSTINNKRSVEMLIARADEALYLSKSEGRNRVTYLPFNYPQTV